MNCKWCGESIDSGAFDYAATHCTPAGTHSPENDECSNCGWSPKFSRNYYSTFVTIKIDWEAVGLPAVVMDAINADIDILGDSVDFLAEVDGAGNSIIDPLAVALECVKTYFHNWAWMPTGHCIETSRDLYWWIHRQIEHKTGAGINEIYRKITTEQEGAG